ncbi:MAG: hypothetical protein IPP57_22630 [Candidatus Obscuribacter sp.]|nr:hypothetical protein [Candidatus Obscuribacter sp.]
MNINIFLPFLATKSVCVSLLITSLALACAFGKIESDVDYKIGGTAQEHRHKAGTISESDLQLHISKLLGMPQNSVIKLFGKPLAQTVNNKGENALIACLFFFIHGISYASIFWAMAIDHRMTQPKSQ